MIRPREGYILCKEKTKKPQSGIELPDEMKETELIVVTSTRDDVPEGSKIVLTRGARVTPVGEHVLVEESDVVGLIS